MIFLSPKKHIFYHQYSRLFVFFFEIFSKKNEPKGLAFYSKRIDKKA